MVKALLRNFVPEFLIGFYHLGLNFLGALFYGFPSRKLKVIGVTGTNGKTTAVNLIYEILKTAGFKAAAFSSVNFKIGDDIEPNLLKMTMPGRWKLQKLLKKAVKAGCGYAVVEVTSEGIKQHRHRFIKFDTAVITNLRPEHLEAHGSFEKYRQAKGQLFRMTKGTHIVNLDDKNAEYFLNFRARQKYLYAAKNVRPGLKFDKHRIIRADMVNLSEKGSNFKVEGKEFYFPLPGLFNVYNALAAIATCLAENISLEVIKSALEKAKSVPGRMETIQEKPFKVVVDYAHTPDALESVYEMLSRNSKFAAKRPPKGRIRNSKFQLICVLGSAGGGRDKWKRPEMGKIAAKYCEYIILTNEDPYDENPHQILSDIKSGVSNFSAKSSPEGLFRISNLYEVLDRREAIKKAVNLAKPGDTVIITGKGSEPWMCLADGKKIPWDDRKIAKEALGMVK